jgi:TRAP-type mannitol/chloroaromatic compound transport system permease small subunit
MREETAPMAGVSETVPVAKGIPAAAARMFGWYILAAMAAFLTNNILTFWFGLPGTSTIFGFQANGDPNAWMWMQLALYILAPVAAIWHVLRTPGRSLRDDAKAISDANAFLIRAAFWVVLLVGLADTVVSFLRVEGYLPRLVGDAMALDLGKSEFRGRYVHIPFMLTGIVIAIFNRSLGFIWLALLVVMAELLIVFSRFIFSYEQAFMGDLVRFWYAALFLFASAYTLLEDGHVRVDVIYAGFRRRARGRVNALGSIMLGITLCWTILLIGMWGKSSLINAPILIYETTQTGFGMYVKYFMAGFLGVFAVTMMMQFVSSMMDAVADIRNDPGGKPDQHASHIA